MIQDCTTCANRAQTLDENPPSCWTCASVGARTAKFPQWRPIEVSRRVRADQPQDPLKVQVGGSHYKDMPFQPVEFITANKLGFCAGNVIKYVCRADKKGGVQDLEKARHYLDLMISMSKKSAESPGATTA